MRECFGGLSATTKGDPHPQSNFLKVIIVDDHAMLRRGLCQTFNDLGWEVVAEAGRAQDAVGAFKNLEWDLGILDVNLPDKNGLDLLHDLRREGVAGPILVHSLLPDSAVAARVFKIGGNGFINKGCNPDELILAAKRVAEGGRYVSPRFAEDLAESLSTGQPMHPHDALSDREYQVMCQIAYGKSPGQIAEMLGCNINTISTYRARLLAKLKLKNSMEVMRYAIAHRLVTFN